MIPIRRALRLGAAPQVAFVGAGGKTSALFALAREFQSPVLVSTSTHFAEPQLGLGDKHVVANTPAQIAKLDPASLQGVVIVTSGEIKDERVTGLNSETLSALSEIARAHSLPLLIEADGGRMRPLKAPAEHEPAIPEFVDEVVIVAGLSAIGKPLVDEIVHRPERFAELSGLQLGDPITADVVAKVLQHQQGGLKNIPPRARTVVLLNQADTLVLEGMGRGLAKKLCEEFDAAWVASLQEAPELKAVYEPVAGILLAAGESKRLGKNKQFLDWKGQPFVRRVAETALAAGIQPLIVVTGFEAGSVEVALAGLDLWVVRNENWQAGQSTSVKAGLAALPKQAGSCVFLVVDQPQLPTTLLEALRAEHATTLAPIISPLVDGNRSNPVLFDRSTFQDFAALEGDVGGRAIFSKHKVSWLPWLDVSLAIDVDKPEDYDRLVRQAGS